MRSAKKKDAPKKSSGKDAAATRQKKGSAEAHRPPLAPQPPRPLNQRQEDFCRAYMRLGKEAEAYREVYGDVHGAAESASRLLTSAKVRERIAALRAEAAAGDVLTLRESLLYLARAVRTPLGEIDEGSDLCQAAEYLVHGGMRGQLRRGNAPSGNEEVEPEMTTVKLKSVDKLKALELSAKLRGLLRDTLQVEAGDTLAELLGEIRSGR